MKFLCVGCDAVMEFAERQLPGDGTLVAVFRCPACTREMALLTNPMETQLVSGLGIKVGGRTVPEQPFEIATSALAEGRPDAFSEPVSTGRVAWDDEATQRLQNVPSFVRGMVKRIYTDYARERGIARITTAIMDRARSDLGLEGM
ncbi:MAG: PCP reductase family protein [Longimicrobiales bacterium]